MPTFTFDVGDFHTHTITADAPSHDIRPSDVYGVWCDPDLIACPENAEYVAHPHYQGDVWRSDGTSRGLVMVYRVYADGSAAYVIFDVDPETPYGEYVIADGHPSAITCAIPDDCDHI